MSLWGKKDDELPAELKGLTPEQIVEKIKNLDTLQTELEQLRSKSTEKDNQIQQIETQRTQLEERLTALESERKPIKKDEEEEEVSIFSDPTKFIDKQTKETQNVALMSGVMSAKMYAQGQMSDLDKKIFRKYEKEIDTIVGGYPPAMRIQPQIWLNALIFTKGQHIDELNKARDEKTEFFSEEPTRGRHEEHIPDDKLSPDEEAYCDSMHWDKKRYLEMKKKGRSVGTHVQYSTTAE